MDTKIGIIGAGVIGSNLALNFVNKGYSVSSYDIDPVALNKLSQMVTTDQLSISTDLPAFIENLEKPKTVMLMVKAGEIIDEIITSLIPLLSPGDIIIDGGNSHYQNSINRYHILKQSGIHFIGMGISGGALGARLGPALMPGGSMAGWSQVEPLFRSIAARTESGLICCEWVGTEGSGHFVKMVHNGIEYADMELIAELYHILKTTFALNNQQISDIFSSWNNGRLSSYLLDITCDILTTKDVSTNSYLLDLIVDKAGQKGTGKWSVETALKWGIPFSIINSAVEQRFVSSQYASRQRLAKELDFVRKVDRPSDLPDINQLEQAFYLARLLTYKQGFDLVERTNIEFDWEIDLSTITKIWQAGCIIRSQLVVKLTTFFENNNLASFFHKLVKPQLSQLYHSLQQLIIHASEFGVLIPAFTASFNYLTGITSARLPANLIQAQRDYFGSHGFSRIDSEGFSHHGPW